MMFNSSWLSLLLLLFVVVVVVVLSGVCVVCGR